MKGGCSDDSFEYFRAGLLLCDHETVESLVNDVVARARLLPRPRVLEADALTHVASEGHERKAKAEMKC